MKKAACLALAVLLAAPPPQLVSAPEMGTIKGAVTVSSRPIRGVALAFVDLASGSIYRATSTESGAFEARVPVGRYVLTTENGAGLAVGRAPSLIAVLAGQVATADVDLAPIPGALVARAQTPTTPPADQPTTPGTITSGTGTQITHDPIGCVVANEFPLIDANIQPAGSVARARIYFKSALSDELYYIEMTPSETGFTGKLPKPNLTASPITYYIEATTTEFGESRTPDMQAIVVNTAEECPDDKKVAAIGPPGEVTVFSAATGAAVNTAVLGGVGAAALGTAAILAILGGAAVAGITAAVVVSGDTTTTTTTTLPPPPPPPPPPTTTTTTTTTTTLRPPTAFR